MKENLLIIGINIVQQFSLILYIPFISKNPLASQNWNRIVF